MIFVGHRAVLRGKFITLTSILKRRKDSGQLRKQGRPPRKTLSPHGFIGESYKHLKKKKKRILQKLFQTVEEVETLPS